MAKITYNNNSVSIDTTLEISKLNIPASSNSTTLSSGTNGQVLATNGTSVYWSTPLYAASSSAGGAATSANKLNTDAGSASQPVYFSDGIPKAINTSITTTAPSVTSTDATIPTSQAVWSAITNGIAANDALVYKGTLGTNGTISSLPATHEQGWTYKIITAGSYAGQTCSVGDMIICIVDGSSANNSHWTVVQNNVDLVGTEDSIGLIKNGSSVTSATGYTPSPIIGGIPYYKDTTYANKAAAENGTEVSLVTTGEKYNWNSKAAGDHSHTNYVTLDTNQTITGIKTFENKVTFNYTSTYKNADSASTSAKCFGLYQWGDKFQFTYRNASDDTYLGTAFEIDGSSGVTAYSSRPTVNGSQLALTSDIPTRDTAMSDTSTNPVQNKAIKAYIDNLVGDIETLLQSI